MLKLLFATLLLQAAESPLQVGETYWSCHTGVRSYEGAVYCNDETPAYKGKITDLKMTTTQLATVTLQTQTGVKTFETHPAALLRTSGCVEIPKFKKKVCVGDAFFFSTSGPCSGMFETEVLGVNEHQIYAGVGGMNYYSPLSWIDGCQVP